jgi:hemoglobin-like flavoprotein
MKSQWHDLTDADIDRVRHSFDHFWSVSQKTVDLFYERLFEIAPELRPMFSDDMSHQKQKFVSTLAVVVGSLHHVDIVFPMVDTLARHHVAYGVQPAHYAPVGQALLWSLERGLGRHWTPEVAASWARAYQAITNRMMASAAA